MNSPAPCEREGSRLAPRAESPQGCVGPKEAFMARQSAFQEFLQEFQIETRGPSSEAARRKAESKLGFPNPDPLRSCYLTCDGGQAKRGPEGPRSAVELLSLGAALDYDRVPKREVPRRIAA